MYVYKSPKPPILHFGYSLLLIYNNSLGTDTVTMDIGKRFF